MPNGESAGVTVRLGTVPGPLALKFWGGTVT